MRCREQHASSQRYSQGIVAISIHKVPAHAVVRPAIVRHSMAAVYSGVLWYTSVDSRAAFNQVQGQRSSKRCKIFSAQEYHHAATSHLFKEGSINMLCNRMLRQQPQTKSSLL
jgi:hypothetical protein